MKRIIILVILMSAVFCLAAETVSYTNYEPGDSLTADGMNSRFTTLYSLVNGNLDSVNIEDGSIAAVDLANDAVTNTKLANDAASLYNVSGGVMSSTGGNIGIGTTSPSRKLSVYGGDFSVEASGNAEIILESTDSATILQMISGGGDIDDKIWQIVNSAGQFQIRSRNDDGSSKYKPLTLLPEGSTYLQGSLGIGTDTPEYSLHISGSGNQAIQVDGGAAFLILQDIDAPTDQKKLAFYNSNGSLVLRQYTDEDTTKREALIVTPLGYVGIGTVGPDHDLEIGTGTYSEIDAGESQFTTSSSREYKENITPIHVDRILEKVSAVPVTTYDFRREYSDDDESRLDKLGLIAEDFHTVFGRGSNKQINGQEVQMALWLAVQELITKNEELASINEELEARIELLEGK